MGLFEELELAAGKRKLEFLPERHGEHVEFVL
jgi:hypothetical protein